ncbi:MAG: UDP-glucose 4-epimerase GalE [Patescibacteria group bacterium]|nr:UDP-glucose 4-epimerase GalE [Patescibacteria group bacterium]
MRILVTGGAGYIGSHMVRMLEKKNIYTVVLDSLEHGHQAAIPQNIPCIVGNVGDGDLVKEILHDHAIDAVIHFAGYLLVEESVKDPVKYMVNNIIRPVAILEAMEEAGVKYFIFSSTAAVYGFPQIVPIPEDHPKNPVSPYGISKLSFEYLLSVYSRKQTIRSISLRYFNACGASLDGNHGEAHDPETHIIPLALKTAMGKRKEFFLYGTDYETRDGTCERDYIHIEDLCEAHLLAWDALAAGHQTDIFNVGTGRGVTNKEVVSEVKRITGKDFSVLEKPRRPGDPSVLVADSKRIMKELGWKPQHSDIETIITSAWKWHTTHPHGYENV